MATKKFKFLQSFSKNWRQNKKLLPENLFCPQKKNLINGKYYKEFYNRTEHNRYLCRKTAATDV